MKKVLSFIIWVLKIALGCAIFALGFDIFLEPNGLNAGGISGIAMIVTELLGFGTVGMVSLLINLPLFVLGGKKIGLQFFIGSVIGTLFLSFFIDLFTVIPAIDVEPLLAAVYGGVLGGAGLGIVFMVNASTGGSDILIRLMKLRKPNMNIGQIGLYIDLVVATATGIVFGNINNMLYSLIAMFATCQIIDAVIYHFDYSKVALIITREYESVSKAICDNLDRGVTYLYGQGYYSREDTKVVLAAVKKDQLAQLKEMVVEIDPKAFIIVQEAHQVLGDGFAKYSKDSL